MKNNYTENNLLVSFIISALLHVIILLISFYGLPFGPRPLPEEKIITFELLPVSSINNVKTKQVQKDQTIKSEDAKKIEKSKIAEAQEEKPKEDPKKEVKPEAKEEKKEAEPLPTKEKKKEEPKKDIKKEEKPKEDKKKETPKKDELEKKKEEKKKDQKKKAPNDKELDSLLKNLEKQSDGNNEKSKKVNREKSDAKSDAFGPFDENSPESLTNDELIKQQIMKHWNQPISSVNEEIIIVVKISLSIKGEVENSKITSEKCPIGKDILCSATKDSIIRAITNASPLVNLLPDDYSSWQEINITFDTRRSR